MVTGEEEGLWSCSEREDQEVVVMEVVVTDQTAMEVEVVAEVVLV